MFRSFLNIYLYIYIYIYIYIYWKRNGKFCVLLQKNEMFSRSFTFLAKEHCILCVLLRSLQKNVAFFYVLCKRMLRSLCSFPFFRKERKRMERSFGSHKLPKTRKKNGMFLKRTELSLKKGKERKRTRCPTLKIVHGMGEWGPDTSMLWNIYSSCDKYVYGYKYTRMRRCYQHSRR